MDLAIDVSNVLELMPGDGVSEEVANEAPVIGFNLSGTRPPLICFRAWRKEVDRYRSLAAALGPDQPIYAASPPRGDVVDDFPSDTEEWATGFTNALGPLLDRGPLILAGWSFSGVVALHIAETLAAKGHPPVLVILIDTIMPVAKPRGDRRKRGKLHNFIVQLNRSLEIPEPDVRRKFLFKYLKRTFKRILRSRVRNLRSLVRKVPGLATPPTRKAPIGERTDPLQRAIRVGYLKSRPESSTLPVVLYWTEQSKAKLGDSSLGWCLRMFGDFRCYPIDGDHTTLFDPENIERLAAALRDELSRAERRAHELSPRPQ